MKNSFTLIEVLIVLAIVGILAAAVMVAVNPFKRLAQAQDSQRKSHLGSLAWILQGYYVDKGAYPDPGADLMSNSSEGDNWIPGLVPDYIKRLPEDPKQAGLITLLARIIQVPREEEREVSRGQVAQATSETPLQAVYAPPYSGPTAWNYTMGYRFRPNIDGQVTQLWCYSNGGTKNVRLYSDTGTLLANVNVTCNGWASGDITPVSLTAGTFYRVAQYVAATGGYSRTSSAPVTSGNIYIDSGRYSTGDAFPTTTSTAVYGLADITFVSGASSTPTVTTPTNTSVTSTSATLGANVTSNGGVALTARGTCWGTSANPTTNCVAEGGITTGVFTHSRTGLPSNTLIFYRGYATNSVGTSYSTDGSFTTSAAAPACSDSIDNDGDTKVDYPDDPGCSDASDNDESDPLPACSDGLDNDSDTKIDYPNDLGCTNASDNDETDIIPQLSAFKYLYQVTADLQSFTLWATLENLDDPEIYNKPGAKCPRVPPVNTSYNFCIGL